MELDEFSGAAVCKPSHPHLAKLPKLYEKLANIISQAALNQLSDLQVEILEEELGKLVHEKKGEIEEITYDELMSSWDKANSRS